MIIVFVYIMSCLFWGCDAGGFLFGVGGWYMLTLVVVIGGWGVALCCCDLVVGY